MAQSFLKDLLRSDKTVYSFKELSLLWPAIETKNIKSRVNYYVKKGDLYRIRRGLYAKDKNYDPLELATKIMSPSYISFETVLASAGIIFQYYTQIFVASYQSKNIVCDGKTYTFRKIKNETLMNAMGIEIKEQYSIACPERAFLDTLYLNKNYHFDNLSGLNWNKIYEILKIYKNKRMEKVVKQLEKSRKKQL